MGGIRWIDAADIVLLAEWNGKGMFILGRTVHIPKLKLGERLNYTLWLSCGSRFLICCLVRYNRCIYPADRTYAVRIYLTSLWGGGGGGEQLYLTAPYLAYFHSIVAVSFSFSRTSGGRSEWTIIYPEELNSAVFPRQAPTLNIKHLSYIPMRLTNRYHGTSIPYGRRGNKLSGIKGGGR